jgi:hypothetical protein
MRGDRERGLELGLEALAMAREHGDKDQVTISLHNVGRVRLHDGAVDEAAGMFDESLALSCELGYRELIAYGLEACGEVAAARGEHERAVRLLGAALALFDEIGATLGEEEQEGHDRTVAQLREDLGDETFARLERDGRTLSLEQAVAEASRTS